MEQQQLISVFDFWQHAAAADKAVTVSANQQYYFQWKSLKRRWLQRKEAGNEEPSFVHLAAHR